MRELLLLRHGKAESGSHEVNDHERRLTRHGRAAAAEMGRRIGEQARVPSVILASDSRRTRETTAAVLEEIPAGAIELFFLPELYLADARAILEICDAYASNVARIMVVGHNPGLEVIAAKAAEAPVRLRPADLVLIEADDEWKLRLVDLWLRSAE